MLVPCALKPLPHFCGEWSTRFGATAGLRLERNPEGRPLAVVSDGRVLLVAEWREPEQVPNLPDNVPDVRLPGWSVNVPARLFRSLCNLGRKWNCHRHFFIAEEVAGETASAVARADGHRVHFPAQKGRFPDWRDIVRPVAARAALDPAAHPGAYAPVTVAVPQLLRLVGLFEEMGLDQVQLDLPLGHAPFSWPIRFTAISGDSALVVRGCQMPLTLDAKRFEVPQ